MNRLVSRPPRARRAGQAGNTLIGLIIGLLIGLGVALAVALYIAKVPVPFVDKVPHRTPEQDAAEAEHNKNWDPNAPLAGKPAPVPRPEAAPSEPAQQAAAPASAPERRAAASAPQKPKRDPAAILAGQPVDDKPVDTAAPESPRRAASSAREVADPFAYFVQAGAYSSADDAEQQRARLAMQGLSARVSEREQGGRTVYRVRLGPFDNKEEAENQQDRLKAAGADSALVRVERPR